MEAGRASETAREGRFMGTSHSRGIEPTCWTKSVSRQETVENIDARGRHQMATVQRVHRHVHNIVSPNSWSRFCSPHAQIGNEKESQRNYGTTPCMIQPCRDHRSLLTSRKSGRSRRSTCEPTESHQRESHRCIPRKSPI